jgi:pyruvate dehydrogenase E2 component (dihydrolipoamide acetyltransferase)
MPFTVTMPKLSPTMQEGSIAKWHKKVGDKIKAGDLLIEVATDKATVEYTALDDGYLRKIIIPEGGSAIVNQPIAIFTEKANEDFQNYIPEGTIPSAPSPEEQTKEAAPQTEKVIRAKSATYAEFTPEAPLKNYKFEFPSASQEKKNPASPLAKKLAKEKGLNLQTVQGTGPGGRVVSRDLDLAQKDQAARFGKKETPHIIPGTFEEVPLSPMRKVIAERLQQAKSSIPHIYVRQTIDIEPLLATREQLKSANLKISINDFIVKASALALKEHPNCNSGFNGASQSIILFKTIDISVAVSVEQGLITPIIRHADYKDLGEISIEMKELAARAKIQKLRPEEYKGGSFTISNMGMYGITDFCAIINPPQAAILAVGGIEDCPRVKNGAVVAGKKMEFILSADHRVIDGSDAAKWLKTFQKYLENPYLLLI